MSRTKQIHQNLYTYLESCLDETGIKALNDLLECERELTKEEE